MLPYQYGSLMQSQNAYEQNLKNIINQANGQLQQLQQMQSQPMQVPNQPTNLTQNFQFTPSSNSNNNELESKYAENIDEVKNILVAKTGIFVNKAFDTLWVKNVNGDIKVFALNEIIETDPKDEEIYMLKQQIEEMKGMIEDAKQSDNTNVDDETTVKKSTRVQSSKRTNTK